MNFDDLKNLDLKNLNVEDLKQKVLAFADKDSEAMVKFMADSVTYRPPQGGQSITTLKPEIHDVVKMLHEPYDSIKRTICNAVPLKSTKTNFT